MAQYTGNDVQEDSDIARDLWNKSQYGTKKTKGIISFSFIEALYLLESGKITISHTLKNKTTKKNATHMNISFTEFYSLCAKKDTRLFSRYAVYKLLRDNGHIVKTALKFGADFRVYEKGKKPGEAHAKWIVFAVKESEKHSWRDFSAKNRVAHSTRKKLLIGVVDDEEDVTFFQVEWIKP